MTSIKFDVYIISMSFICIQSIQFITSIEFEFSYSFTLKKKLEENS